MPKARVWMTAAAVLVSVNLAGCASDPAVFRDPAGAIQDPETALVIAHAMYWSVFKAHNPDRQSTPFDQWKKGCTAELEHDIWDVWCPAGGLDAPKGTVLGGGLEIKIAKSGKLLSIVIYQ
jgi:hypothetical protein